MNTVPAQSLVDAIIARYRRELTELHRAIYSGAAELDATPALPPGVVVKSVLDRFVNLSIQVSVGDTARAYPGCAVAAGSSTILVTVGAHHRQLRRSMRASRPEANAWACAVLGVNRAASGYYLGPLGCRGDGSPAALHYRLYLDPEHRPCSAPDPARPSSHEPLAVDA